MRAFHGYTFHIDIPIIGRVARQSTTKNGLLYVLTHAPFQFHPDCLLITGESPTKKLPLVEHLHPTPNLDYGDIVRVDPTGDVTVLFDTKATDNSIMLTNACNCRCVMCPQVSVDPPSLFTENQRLLALIPNDTKVLGITGGEPTVKKDELISIMRTCKNRLRKTSIELLSNGIALSDIDYVKDLVLIDHPSITYEIPLYADVDTIHNELVQHPSAFYETFEALHNLSRFHQRIELRIVIMAHNASRLPQLSKFIYRNFPFVCHVAFMGLELEGRARENLNRVWIDPLEYQGELEEAVMVLHRRGIEVTIYNHQLCTLKASLWRFAAKSISSWKNIFAEQCSTCRVQALCGGFFASSVARVSSAVHAIR